MGKKKDKDYSHIEFTTVPEHLVKPRKSALDDALEDLGLFDPDDCEDNPIADEFRCTEDEHNGCNGRCN